MSTYGLVVRDASGNVTLSVTDRITRIIGSFSTGTSAGSLTVNVSGSVWFGIVDAGNINSSSSNVPPIVTLSGSVISWSWATTSYGTRAITVIYGVY